MTNVDLHIAAAWLALEKLTSEEALAAASAALDRGTYSESLGLLHGEKPVWSEVGPLFTKALSELGIPVPSREEAIPILAREYARRLLAGEITPYECARRIWLNLTVEDEADPSLLTFAGLACQWEECPERPNVDVAECRTQVEALNLEAARQLVSGHFGGTGCSSHPPPSGSE